MTINFNNVKTYSLTKRKSKVSFKDFAALGRRGTGFKKFYDSLPDFLAVNSFKNTVNAIVSARKNKKPVVFMMGAHVVKCGLGPLIIDLLKKKVITCISLNGAGIIHDFELAFCGNTSEDVGVALEDGMFGMSKETADFLNHAVTDGNNKALGLGASVGYKMLNEKLKFKRCSLSYNCYKMNIPLTVHVALGADIIHQHPEADGAALGAASFTDFRTFASEVSELGNGGVLLNFGSAVIMPEVFLKALSIARNLGHDVTEFTTANFDMIQHYRPRENIIKRPTNTGGSGFAITGHHEIMIPLLAHAVMDQIAQNG